MTDDEWIAANVANLQRLGFAVTECLACGHKTLWKPGHLKFPPKTCGRMGCLAEMQDRLGQR